MLRCKITVNITGIQCLIFLNKQFLYFINLSLSIDTEEFPKLLKNILLYISGTPTLSPELERLVLETMNRILYNEMGFRGNKDRYYDENNSFIEKVCLTSQSIFFTCDIWSTFVKEWVLLWALVKSEKIKIQVNYNFLSYIIYWYRNHKNQVSWHS